MSDPIYTLVEYVAADRFAVSNAAQDSFVAEFLVGLRVRADCQADGIRLGSVTVATHDAGTGRTLVEVSLDSGAVLTANLTWVLHGCVDPKALPHHNHSGPADGGDLPGVMLTDNSRKFTAGYIQAEGSYTGFFFTQLGAAIDAKKSIYHVANERVALLLSNDAETAFHEAWSVGRIGAVPTDMTVTPLLIAAGGLETPTFNGEDMTGGIVNKYFGLSVTSETSIAGATTLTAAACGKMHVCTGTTTDYGVWLPAASGNAGKLIGIRVSRACTKLITLISVGSDLIDGISQRIMWAGESAILLCDGLGWTKIAGKSISMVCRLQGQESQSIPSATFTGLALQVAVINTGLLADTSNNRVLIRRSCTCHVSAQSSLPSIPTTTLSGVQVLFNGGHLVYGGGIGAFFGVTPTTDALVSCSAGATLSLRAYHAHTTSLATGTGTFLNVTEIVQW